ncbi:uncharacterized protein LOC135491176 [Lineus longissimus]|uniref:uncharacterized protein LOC135491176 n=1 Tax=Lineus longissimus TaxID=88925 RepID=UPI002B4DAD8D
MVQKRGKAGLNTGCTLKLLKYSKLLPRIAAEQHVLGKHKNFLAEYGEGELAIDDGDMECLALESLFYSMNKRGRWLIEEQVRASMMQPPTSRLRVIMLTRENPLEVSPDRVMGTSYDDCLTYSDSALQTMVEASRPCKYQDIIGNALQYLHEGEDDKLLSPYDAVRGHSRRGVQRMLPPPVNGYSGALRCLAEERQDQRTVRESKFQSVPTVKYEIFTPQQISAKHFRIRDKEPDDFKKRKSKYPRTSTRLIDDGLNSGITHTKRRTTCRKVKAKHVKVADFNKGKLEGGPCWKSSQSKHMKLGLYLHLLVEKELGKRRGWGEPAGDKKSRPAGNVEQSGVSRGTEKIEQDVTCTRTVAQQTDEELFFITETLTDENDSVFETRESIKKAAVETQDVGSQVCSDDVEFEGNTPHIVEFPFEVHRKPKMPAKSVISQNGKHPKPKMPKTMVLRNDQNLQLAILPKEPAVLSEQSLESIAAEVGDCMVLAMNLNVPTRMLAILATHRFEKIQTKLEMSVEFLKCWKSMRLTASDNAKVDELVQQLVRLGRPDVAKVVRRCHLIDEELTQESFNEKQNKGFRRK